MSRTTFSHGGTEYSTAAEARAAIRAGKWTGPTVFRMPGYVQCNLVVVPREVAYDFLVFCQRNPKPCPVIEVTDVGNAEPRHSAPGADLRTDLPRYSVYRHGVLAEEPDDITALWREDLVGFLVGSSLTFDAALDRAGVTLEHGVWVLDTALPLARSGPFWGTMVVTMRLMPAAQAVVAAQLTGRYPLNHGAPVHLGDPSAIGANLAEPLYGAPLETIPQGLVPVFWACGVTPQRVALARGLPFLIAHKTGHGFITDLRTDQICIP